MSTTVNVAIAATGFALSVTIAAAVALFVVEQPQAGWAALLVGLLGDLLLVGMIASTGRAQQQEHQLPPPR